MNKMIEIVNTNDKEVEFQMYEINLFKTIVPGESIKIQINSDSEELYYNKLVKNLGIEIKDENEREDVDFIDVSNSSDLESVIENPNINTVNIKSNLSLEKELQFPQSINFNGEGHEISTNKKGRLMAFMSSSTVEDVNLKSTADNKEWNSSYNLQLYTGTHTVKNIKSEGGNSGLLVNGSVVNLEGTIDVSGNTFGGIEVSKGSLAESGGILNIGSANIVNTTEEYGKPTIWIDGEGTVNGADSMTMVEVNGQKHYYLNADNAKNPEESVETVSEQSSEDTNTDNGHKYTKDELLAMKKEEIMKVAENRGIEVSGTKEAMADQIVASYEN